MNTRELDLLGKLLGYEPRDLYTLPDWGLPDEDGICSTTVYKTACCHALALTNGHSETCSACGGDTGGAVASIVQHLNIGCAMKGLKRA